MKMGPLIAEGRAAEVFAWGTSEVLKLARDSGPTTWVDREAQVAGAVADAGIPAPRVVDIVTVGDRRGIVMERVEGPTMMTLLTSKPWLVLKLSRILAELQSQFHQRRVPSLPPLNERLRERITSTEHLTADMKAVALAAMKKQPHGGAVCHGDFHPDNVIMSDRGPMIIDWNDACAGNPLADVARTSLLFKIGEIPGFMARRRLIEALRDMAHSFYLNRYLKLNGNVSDELKAWELPVAAARLSEGIAEEEREELLSLVGASGP